ncbi:MAG: DUF2062 domain-containing protein [Rhodospirillales bacterium]|nr:DUF2062 domain-containing protein [Rhodospirillales bacterium]
MFKRKQKPTFLQRLKSYVWPTIGWKKYVKYLGLRLSRLGNSPRAIAAGVACGVAVSFTPFVGLHFVLAAITAFLCRGNVLASALGTAMGNPWTFPIIWVSVFYTGRWFLGYDGTMNVSFLHVFEKSMHAIISFDFSGFASDVWPVFFPMLVGCIPYYIVAWIVTYYLVKNGLLKIMNKKGKVSK